MLEFLLWTIGLNKIHSQDSPLYNAIQCGEIEGTAPAQVLGLLIGYQTIKEAEKLALSSGGLRTVRALWQALQLLTAIKQGDEPKIIELSKLGYPYNELVERGNKLDEVRLATRTIAETEMDPEEVDELLEDEDEEDDEYEEDDEAGEEDE